MHTRKKFFHTQEWLKDKQLFVVSNRGPLTYTTTPEGEMKASRSAGGVVSALSVLSKFLSFIWVCGAVTDTDRLMARRYPEREVQLYSDSTPTLVWMVATSKKAFKMFYDGVSNAFLWFTHHYLWDLSRQPSVTRTLYTAWEEGYRPVNQAFANAVSNLADRLEGQPVVLLHDYHLFLAPGLLRPRMPHALISHFLHIPWPGSRYWNLLPMGFREEILNSLQSCDVVGLQTQQDVANFLDTCEFGMKDVVVDYQRGIISTAERDILVRAYPISVDVKQLQELGQSPEVLAYEEEMAAPEGVKTIVRVDRLDLSKNIVRGFKAFEHLLAEHPELHGKLRFLALLVPSREGVGPYRRYQMEVLKAIDKINDKYGTQDWRPITAFFENNYQRAIALLKGYDVLLVNPVIDGMNLVAKEGATVNQRKGVIILSQTAGAYQELSEGVIPVSPIDTEDIKHALYGALTMSEQERGLRAELVRKIVTEQDVQNWLLQQLQDLHQLAQERGELHDAPVLSSAG